MPENTQPSNDTSAVVAPNDQPGVRLHHHVHVIFKSHMNERGDPRELEGQLFTIVQKDEDEKQAISGLPKDTLTNLKLKVPADEKPVLKKHLSDQELNSYHLKRRGMWLGELVQWKPVFKAERLVMATDKPLDMAEDVNFSRTPSGALRLGLILLAILGIVEWWQLGAIQNAQGLDTNQLASKWAFFFWGCLLFGVIALVAISKTKSGKRIELHCDPRYSEFCAMGNHVGIIGNSKQRSVFDQALDFVGTFDKPNMEALRDSLITRDRERRAQIRHLETENEFSRRRANWVGQSDWSAMSRYQRNLNEVVEPPNLSGKKGGVPDWLILIIFLGIMGALFVLYPGSGGGG